MNANDMPLHTLLEMAMFHHELFSSYTKAGFTEDQAMQLVVATISAGMMTRGNDD
jgi:hypothetical protein